MDTIQIDRPMLSRIQRLRLERFQVIPREEDMTRLEGISPVLYLRVHGAWGSRGLPSRVLSAPRNARHPAILWNTDKYYTAKTVKYSHYERHL